jgi:hypothetical protein
MDRLRDAPDGRWIRFDSTIGQHSIEAVHEELVRLRQDRLLDLREVGMPEARLAIDEG